jgi:hypothetical protein
MAPVENDNLSSAPKLRSGRGSGRDKQQSNVHDSKAVRRVTYDSEPAAKSLTSSRRGNSKRRRDDAVQDEAVVTDSEVEQGVEQPLSGTPSMLSPDAGHQYEVRDRHHGRRKTVGKSSTGDQLVSLASMQQLFQQMMAQTNNTPAQQKPTEKEASAGTVKKRKNETSESPGSNPQSHLPQTQPTEQQSKRAVSSSSSTAVSSPSAVSTAPTTVSLAVSRQRHEEGNDAMEVATSSSPSRALQRRSYSSQFGSLASVFAPTMRDAFHLQQQGVQQQLHEVEFEQRMERVQADYDYKQAEIELKRLEAVAIRDKRKQEADIKASSERKLTAASSTRFAEHLLLRGMQLAAPSNTALPNAQPYP